MKILLTRWLVLLATLANILFNGTYTKITGLPPINIISDKYFNLFTPAGYAFAIWGVIYLGFIIYAIYQLLPGQRQVIAYDKIAVPFIVINLLGSLWITFFTADQITLSIVVMIATLITGTIAFMKTKKAIEQRQITSKWVIVPFSLFVGWISVAIIANFSAWLISKGWHGGTLGEATLTIGMIIIAGILGIVFTITQRNSTYPLVIAWATLGIYFARYNDYPAIAHVAIIVALIQLVIASAYSLKPAKD